jgi:RNA polymerase sigma-70 factor (ECF subfamily)
MTEKQLLLGLQANDQKAMERFVKKYNTYLCTVIANILGPYGTAQDVEELAQDTFCAVWNHASGIHGNLKYYLCSTGRNKAKSWLRSRRTFPMAEDLVEIPDTGSSLEDDLVQKELSDQIQRAISRLNPKERETFLRYYYYLQTTEEIAKIMHVPIGTVCSRLARGRKKLKQVLAKEVTK